jgi:hypothetical protein
MRKGKTLRFCCGFLAKAVLIVASINEDLPRAALEGFASLVRDFMPTAPRTILDGRPHGIRDRRHLARSNALDVSAKLPEELLVNELLFLDSLIHWDGVVSMALLIARAPRLAVAAAATAFLSLAFGKLLQKLVGVVEGDVGERVNRSSRAVSASFAAAALGKLSRYEINHSSLKDLSKLLIG